MKIISTIKGAAGTAYAGMMTGITRAVSAWKMKELSQFQQGGFELLRALTGTAWSKSTMLQKYESSLYVAACVNKIAEKVSSSQYELFKILNTKGDVQEQHDSEALNLLDTPNPFQTRSEFWKITEINKQLCGDAFWFKVRSGNKVVELWNLRPDLITIIKSPTEFIKAYKFRKSDGTEVIFDPKDIVHFKSPTPLDDYFGGSPLRSCQVRVDTEEYASKFQRDFFLNNARPDAIVKSETNLTKEQKNELRRSFKKTHGGVGNNSKIAIFESGLDYQQISISQREMDYIESLKFTRDDILVAYRMPKPIVAIVDDVNRANSETAMYVFLSETIKPELTAVQETINMFLVEPDFGINLFIEFKDPTPENRDMTIKEYDSGIEKGWLLINEVRAKENLEPIKGGWTLYKPLNMVPVGGLSEEQKIKFVKDFVAKREREKRAKAMELFRGRKKLYKILKKAERMSEIVMEEAKKQIGKGSEKMMGKYGIRKEMRALITEDELRDKYAKMILKKIDFRAERLKEAVTDLSERQERELMRVVGEFVKSRKGKSKDYSSANRSKVKDFFDKQAPVWSEFIIPYLLDMVKESGMEAMLLVEPDNSFDMTDRIRKAIERRADEFGLGVNKTTRKRINKAIEEGLDEGEGLVGISDRISGIYKEFPAWRSDLIARTESTAANNEGFIESYKQSEVVSGKEWINAGDDKVRDAHKDKPVGVGREIVKLDENFSNGLPYPQEPNCRCVIGPAIED